MKQNLHLSNWLLAIILSLCSALSTYAEIITIGKFNYALNEKEKTATVFFYDHYASDNIPSVIVVPSTVTYNHKTYKVTSLSDNCFAGYEKLKSVTLPEGITSIGGSCFAECISLENIYLPKGITLIGGGCFAGCISLENISLPEGITSIGESCFAGCISLENISLPEGITSIGESCFQDCSYLKTVTIQEGLTALPKNCFAECDSLVNVSLPDGITSLGDACFFFTPSLKNVTLPDGIASLGDHCFMFSGLESITLPKTIKKIGEGCFQECSYLKTVTIQEGLTALPKDCFAECDSLVNVSLPDGITSLGEWCFAECSSLKNITLPEGLSSLGNSCFSGCRGFKNITLPEGLSSLGKYCLRGCWDLKSISLPASLKEVGDGFLDGTLKDIIVMCFAAEPPMVSYNNKVMDDKCRLFVWQESVDRYKENDAWNAAYFIKPLYPVNMIVMRDNVTLLKKQTMKLECSMLPENAFNKNVVWSSNDEDIAVVTQDGEVKAVSVGEVDITAEAADGSGVTAVCHVTVKGDKEPWVTVSNIKFEESFVTIAAGETHKLNVSITPLDATDKELIWKSADSSVVTVSSDGTIVGVSEGKASVYALTTDGSYRIAKCMVTVTAPTGINNAITNSSVRETNRYSANGQIMETTARGMNIVKYSDGSVKKIMVP